MHSPVIDKSARWRLFLLISFNNKVGIWISIMSATNSWFWSSNPKHFSGLYCCLWQWMQLTDVGVARTWRMTFSGRPDQSEDTSTYSTLRKAGGRLNGTVNLLFQNMTIYCFIFVLFFVCSEKHIPSHLLALVFFSLFILLLVVLCVLI